MQTIRKTLLASAAAVALAGAAGLAAAQITNTHVVDVRLPDGYFAHIRYVGDTPPTVSVAPAPVALSLLTPAADPFDSSSPSAAMTQMPSALDRQVTAMLQEASVLSGLAFSSPALMQVDVGKLPTGAQGVSTVSTISGNSVCTRSVEFKSLGDGERPQVVTRTSGNCTHKYPGPGSLVATQQYSAGRDAHLLKVSNGYAP